MGPFSSLTPEPTAAESANSAWSASWVSDPVELSVAQARDHFSQRVNRAAFGNEVTYMTRRRKHERVATTSAEVKGRGPNPWSTGARTGSSHQ